MTRLSVLLTAACLIVGCGSNHNMSAGPTTPFTPTPANNGKFELTGTVETMTPYGHAPLTGVRIDLSDGAGQRSAVRIATAITLLMLWDLAVGRSTSQSRGSSHRPLSSICRAISG